MAGPGTENRESLYHLGMQPADSITIHADSQADLSVPARFGRALKRNQKAVTIIQWTVVALYLPLLITPLFLAAPGPEATPFSNLSLFCRFLFWGIGWPLIILSMMLFGRAWCGIFCPDGTVTEFISLHGRKRSIPRWIRWRGWPFTMLAATTLYGQLVGVYDFAPATLLLLGLPSLGALGTGFLYGNGKRIWCMYLCPANATFSMLSKIAPFHFRVNLQKWKRYPGIPPRVNCAPLINIKQMKSTSACHACGRCGGYMDAVDLSLRTPESEIVGSKNKDTTTAEALTLIFGVIGICTVAMQWAGSPLFSSFRTALADWLSGIGVIDVLRETTTPWWILANYPDADVVRSLFDGISILSFIAGGGSLLALAVLTCVWLASRIAGEEEDVSWQKLSLGLIPSAGCATFIGLATLSVMQLRSAGLELHWAPWLQMTLLWAGSLFSMWLGIRMLVHRLSARHILSFAFYILPVLLLHGLWSTRILF